MQWPALLHSLWLSSPTPLRIPEKERRANVITPSNPWDSLPIFKSMGEEEGSLEDAGTPLSSVANAFEDLAAAITSDSSKADCDLSLSQFTHACSLVSVLFGSLGFAFKFAEMEYVAKVRDLSEASKTYSTLNDILDYDVNRNTVRQPGSLSRNLRRVRQGLDLIRALCEQFLSSDRCSLKAAATTAYEQVCAPYHTWTIRKAVGAGMYALPTREQLLLRLNETDHSVQKEMARYIAACNPVIEYIDKHYISRDISLDW